MSQKWPLFKNYCVYSPPIAQELDKILKNIFSIWNAKRLRWGLTIISTYCRIYRFSKWKSVRISRFHCLLYRILNFYSHLNSNKVQLMFVTTKANWVFPAPYINTMLKQQAFNDNIWRKFSSATIFNRLIRC